jgi:hypothetical protein
MFKKAKYKLVEITSKFNHFYYIPLFGFVCWYILLFSIVGLWLGREGGRSYTHLQKALPLPLERLGAIISPVFFLIFVCIHSIIFCISMYLEFYHRKIGKLIMFIKPTVQIRLAFASISIGIIAQFFFIIQAGISVYYIQTKNKVAPHYAIYLATFGILVMISLVLNFTNYYIMGQYYRKYVNGEKWNKFTVSFIVKIVWLAVTITLTVTCCMFYVKRNIHVSSILEWCFHFWYGLLFAFWTYDLYPLTELRALRNRTSPEVVSNNSKFQSLKEKISFSHKLTSTRGTRMPDLPDMEGLNRIAPIAPIHSFMSSDKYSQYSEGLDMPTYPLNPYGNS